MVDTAFLFYLLVIMVEICYLGKDLAGSPSHSMVVYCIPCCTTERQNKIVAAFFLWQLALPVEQVIFHRLVYHSNWLWTLGAQLAVVTVDAQVKHKITLEFDGDTNTEERRVGTLMPGFVVHDAHV